MRSVLSQSGELASLSRFEKKYFNVLILNLSLKLRKFQLDFVSNSNNIYFSSSCHISGGVSYLELDYAESLPRRKASPFLSSDCEFGLVYPIRNHSPTTAFKFCTLSKAVHQTCFFNPEVSSFPFTLPHLESSSKIVIYSINVKTLIVTLGVA